jgi:hypothetical protein
MSSFFGRKNLRLEKLTVQKKGLERGKILAFQKKKSIVLHFFHDRLFQKTLSLGGLGGIKSPEENG